MDACNLVCIAPSDRAHFCDLYDYNTIFLAKQTKVIDSVYLFVSQHYTQILHKQLVKDRLLDALLMIYNKSIYT